jgi:D-3-phosphoglycerate dehydrogenase
MDSSTIVLLADTFQTEAVAQLESLGCIVEFDSKLKDESLVKAISDKNPDILVVRSTKVSPAMMNASHRLSIIIRAGAGYDTIDVNAASTQGISVANCPGKNSIAVAELTWGLILACDRRIPSQVASLKSGRWEKKEYSKASGLFGRTIGVIGLGGIGQEVIVRAKSFGMKITAWSRNLTPEIAEQLGVMYCKDLHCLAEASDVVSVHLASTEETKHLLNYSFFQSMKDGAIFVNTSRGAIVDEKALLKAAQEKKLKVGLDVYENEPATGDCDFTPDIASLDHLYGTHHIGASTTQAQEQIASEVVRIIATYKNEGRVLHCVNQAIEREAKVLLSVRHKNLPGVLAHVFDELNLAGVNVEEMQNTIYQGGNAACARMQLSIIPTQEQLNTIKNNENIFSVTLTTQN